MQSRTRILAVSLIGCLLACTVARAADVLQAIPDTALAVVLVNRLEETSDKVEKIAGMVHAPQQSLLTMLRVQTGIHEGFDEKGTAALAVLPAKEEGAMPQAALLVPVTDYKKFLAQLQPDDASKKFAEVRLAGHPMLICQQGDYAVLAAPDAKGVLEDLLNSVKDVGGELTPQRTWLGEVDAAAVGTTAGIKFAVEQAQAFLPLFACGAGGFAQQQSIAEMLNFVEQGLKSVGSEVTHVAVGVKADENSNLRVASRIRFASGGQWSNAAKGIKAPKDGILAGLPGGPCEMAGGMMVPQGLRENFGTLIAGSMKVNPLMAQLPAEQQTRLAQATVEMLAPIDSIAMSMGTPKSGEPLYTNTVMILKVDNAQKYLDQYAATIALFSEALKNPQGPAINYQAQKIDVDGSAALDILTDLSGFNQPGAADVKPMFEKMFGPGDKVHAYLTVVDDKTLVMAYINVDNAKRALVAAKAPAGGLSADPQIAETTALLPKSPQLLAYIQLRAILGQAGPALALTPVGPLPQLTDVPSAPPIGIAGKLSAIGLNIDIAVPAATLQAAGQVVARLRGQ